MGDEQGNEHSEEEMTPQEAEAQIDTFIVAADEAGGSPTAELTAEALANVRDAWNLIQQITSAQSNNKVIAMMLLSSRRARETDPQDPEHWMLHATSTILSGQIPAANRG